MLDFKKFCIDYSIDYNQRRSNVIAFDCPLCNSSKGSKTWTGGFITHNNKAIFSCFRCGTHSAIEVISNLINCTTKEALIILKKYDSDYTDTSYQVAYKRNCTELVYPPTKELDSAYTYYLENRGFDAECVTKKYNLLYTKHIGNRIKDCTDRIIFTATKAGKAVSYTARTILKEDPIRYLSCPSEKEVSSIKSTLYCLDKCDITKPVALLEGCFDALKFGSQGVACYGISYALEQVLLLREFPCVYIAFDPEEKALYHARKLKEQLSYFTKVHIIDLETNYDVGDFSKSEIESLRNFLGFEKDSLEHLIK